MMSSCRSHTGQSEWTQLGLAMLFLSCAALVGCPSVATLVTATPLGKGNIEVTIQPGAAGVVLPDDMLGSVPSSTDERSRTDERDDGESSGASTTGASDPENDSDDTVDVNFGNTLWIPMINSSFRYGLTDTLDMGLSLRGYSLLSLDLKVNLINTQNFALSIAPSLGVSFVLILQPELPILVDIKFSESFRVNIGVKYAPMILWSTDNMTHFFGGSIGFEFELGGSFYMAPNVSVLAAATDNGIEAMPFLNVGIGFKYRDGKDPAFLVHKADDMESAPAEKAAPAKAPAPKGPALILDETIEEVEEPAPTTEEPAPAPEEPAPEEPAPEEPAPAPEEPAPSTP
jgi:hypothetical protein